MRERIKTLTVFLRLRSRNVQSAMIERIIFSCVRELSEG